MRIYQAGDGERFDLGKPVATFETKDLIIGLEWAPDEQSLAVMAIVFEPLTKVELKLLDLNTGSWTTLATVAIPPRTPQIDLLAHKIMSWTQ